MLFISEFSKKISRHTTTFSTKLGKCSFNVVVLQRMAQKPTRLYFLRAVSLFCSLTLLFGDILHDVVNSTSDVVGYVPLNSKRLLASVGSNFKR